MYRSASRLIGRSTARPLTRVTIPPTCAPNHRLTTQRRAAPRLVSAALSSHRHASSSYSSAPPREGDRGNGNGVMGGQWSVSSPRQVSFRFLASMLLPFGTNCLLT